MRVQDEVAGVGRRDALQSEGTRLLTRNHRQEALSRAYVQAIAARCGMSISVPYPDYGIDMSLNDIEISNRTRSESGYRLDVQTKATTRAGVTEDSIQYDLQVRSYDLLRASPDKAPRILVVLALPGNESRWCSQNEEALILRHCAYWLSLKGWPPSTNRKSVRVSLPRANVFSMDAVRGIMNRIKAGENP
ncbi:MAG TPA: hypothetical protein DDY78_00945 [Planctomycetales bacterium]|nr:hypothetical protein [Planctomycetales bacterium]